MVSPLVRFTTALLLTSCAAELSVPPDANITCTKDEDCPTGTDCREDVGFCVSVGGTDEEGPEILNVLMENDAARLGVTVQLSFEISEAIVGTPAVYLDGADQTFFAHEPGIDREALTFEYRYIVTEAIAEGDYAVSVFVVDRAGNPTDQGVGMLSVDYSPPTGALRWQLLANQSELPTDSVSNLELETETGALIDSLEAVRSADGAVFDLLDTLDAGTADPVDPSLTRFNASFEPSSSGFVDGDSVFLRAVLQDGAGNRTAADAIRSDSVLLDGIAPTDLSAQYIGALPAQSRDVPILVSAGAAQQVWLEGDITDTPQWFDAVFPVTRLVTLTAGAGDKAIDVRVRDGALNESGPFTVNVSLVVSTDTDGPVLLSATATAPRQVDLTFDEPLDPDSTDDPSNFTLTKLPGGVVDTPDPVVLSPQLSVDGQSVVLFLDRDLVGQDAYDVSVSGARDLLDQLQDPNPATAAFLGFGTAPDPAAPTLQSPPAGQHWQDATPSLQWSGRAGAESYDVQLSADAGFTSLVVDETVLAPSTSYTVPTTLTDETYHWRVRSDVPPMTWQSGSFEMIGNRLYVSGTGSTCSPCFGNRDKPYATIGEALAVSETLGVNQIRVHGAQTYNEIVTLRPGVDLRGGYDPTWTTRSPTTYETTIDSGSSVVVAAIGIVDPTLFELFTVLGNNSLDAVGLFVSGCNEQLTIAGNTIDVANNTNAAGGESAAVMVLGSGQSVGTGPVFSRNTITGGARYTQIGSNAHSAAMIVSNSAPHLDRNLLIGRLADQGVVGLALRGVGTPLLTNNLIMTVNTFLTTCIAVEMDGVYGPPGLAPVLTNNTLVVPACDNQLGNSQSRLATFVHAAPYFTNNLLVNLDGAGTCVEEVNSAGYEPELFDYNGFIGCGSCWYDDSNSGCLSDGGFTAAAAEIGESATQNREGATTMFVDGSYSNPFVDAYDFDLAAGAPSWARTGGKNTGTASSCGTQSCGDVIEDFDGVNRTPGYSRGAFER